MIRDNTANKIDSDNHPNKSAATTRWTAVTPRLTASEQRDKTMML